MSMILAIANSNSLVMAADTKASSTSGLLKYPDIHKIKKINSNCGIAIATKIVEHIASASNVVNDKVDILTFPLQSV